MRFSLISLESHYYSLISRPIIDHYCPKYNPNLIMGNLHTSRVSKSKWAGACKISKVGVSPSTTETIRSTCALGSNIRTNRSNICISWSLYKAPTRSRLQLANCSCSIPNPRTGATPCAISISNRTTSLWSTHDWTELIPSLNMHEIGGNQQK